MPDDMKFCTHCGNRLDQPVIVPAEKPAEDGVKICPNCQSKVEARYRFCTECGFDFNSQADLPESAVNAETPSQPESAPLPEIPAQTGFDSFAGTAAEPL